MVMGMTRKADKRGKRIPVYFPKGKRAFLRIIEAFVAILVITGVLLFLYIGNVPKVNEEEVVYPIIRVSLKEITTSAELRIAVLSFDVENGVLDDSDENYSVVNASFARTIPADYGYYFNICNITSACGINDNSLVAGLAEQNVFSDYIVVFSTPGSPASDPKKLRLFVWEKG